MPSRAIRRAPATAIAPPVGAGQPARLAFTLWKADVVKVTQGEDQIGEYNQNERSYRQWCKQCGGHLLTRHPQWGLVDVYAATIPDFPFAPGVHVNYESTVLPMKDGLPAPDFPESWAALARRSPVTRGPAGDREAPRNDVWKRRSCVACTTPSMPGRMVR